MTLIDRTELRQQVNKLYATATQEQQKILLGVMELIESAPGYEEFICHIPGETREITVGVKR